MLANKKRFFIIFILGFSSGLPLALLTGTLQAWYADAGISVLGTGLLSLIGLPYVYRIAWGPLLDRYSLFSFGKRRSWIFITQLLLCLGFNAMAWFSPATSPKLLAGFAFILAIFSATQDIAIDAHRVEFLTKKEHGLGASIAVLGYRVALLIAGGGALILAQHLGWAFCYRLIGSFMIIGILATLKSQEPFHRDTSLTLIDSFIKPVKELLLGKKFFALFLFILFYKLGEAFTTTTSGIVMPFLIQGLGFSLEAIGTINKLVGVGAIVVGGLAAGFILTRVSLFKALLLFGLLQAATNILFIFLAIMGKNLMLLTVAVISDNFAAGMGSTALVALFMRLVNQSYTGTQFSILVAISTLPRIFSGPIAGLIQLWVGWVGLYQISFLLALGYIPFLLLLKNTIIQSASFQLEPKRFLSVTS